MTKTKRARKIAELKAKIGEAQKRWDLARVVQYQKELSELTKVEIVKTRTTLLDCIKEQTPEERREVTTRIIYTIAIGDILWSAIGDVEEYMRTKFGITEISVTEQLKQAMKLLQNAVKSIDDVGSDFFSENYMNIVEELEQMYGATLKNATLNKLLKAARMDSKKGI